MVGVLWAETHPRAICRIWPLIRLFLRANEFVPLSGAARWPMLQKMHAVVAVAFGCAPVG